MTEKEYKENISKIVIPKKKLNSLYLEIERNILSVLESNIKFNKKITIDFLSPLKVDEKDKYIMNACVFKVDMDSYKIVLFPKLIEELYKYAHFVASYGKIYKSINREHKEIEALRNSIFFNWIDFIFFHEYAHIIYGHLNFSLINNYRIDEINEEINLTKKEIDIIRVLEAEADYYGSRFAMVRYNLTKDNVYKFFNVQCDEYEMIYDYMFSLNFLFEWFEEKNNESSLKLHPLPSERLTIINEAIMSTPDPNIKHLNLFEYQLKCLKARVKHKLTLKNDIDSFIEIIKEGSDFIEFAKKIRAEYINPFRERYNIKKNASSYQNCKKLLGKSELLNKLSLCIKNEVKEKILFGLITINSKTFKGEYKHRKNLNLRGVCEIIYEDIFNSASKLTLIEQFIPYGRLLMGIIVIKDFFKIKEKIDKIMTKNIDYRQGLCLIALSHLTFQFDEECRGSSFELIEKCCQKLYTDDFKITNLLQVLNELEELGCVFKKNEKWYVNEEVNIM